MRGNRVDSILFAGCLLTLSACNPLPESVAERTAPDSCSRHPLAGALPTARIVAGFSRNSPQCDWSSASVSYGNLEGNPHEGDEVAPRGCRIEIDDFQAELPEELKHSTVAGSMRKSLEFNRAVHRAAIAANVSNVTIMRNGGEWLTMIGGPQHLPIIGNLPHGGQYAIPVPSIQDGAEDASLIGLLRGERYGLTITCVEKIRTQADGRALLAPWIAALNLGALQ